MFDIGISELGVIGVVALIVLGPEKLPKVARTVGNLLGRAQRYMADVKSEVNRQMELEELRSMKSTVESAAQDIQSTVAKNIGEVNHEFDSAWREATAGLSGEAQSTDAPSDGFILDNHKPKRLKKSTGQAVPLWYRRQARVRSHALSGAARVARHRPRSGL
ncbi:MAG: Sec-independent protein translocase subunit TatB [Betaproteobacteria bacterium]|jgi:sec-independent protein translocase protein TatB|uniref:Sec-independent protein translocase protein TatB n=1 Tax=Thiomonas delicata TaxID=364030 RepID=A0A238CZI5_THIDL|nr:MULTISPECIES: Sec-independent protein translocase protein TatB [Thiomonas]MDE2129735.1 Sec-independent protein translocase subunit TatB [Betaproteobacteria bacterium]OZB44189.1 MAG: Sec-independent protein translocase TatB [Thiomonas sp. 15-66-11]OZB44888.1 MAG: Sec-independent protein translocase TatB [Thiomonas sp. 14-66-4]OZB61029.1 MAG: Sec-independent protein translocase TatB [Thiomonas sp. 13-66-29]SBP86400.1 Sec-independent protein translocase protein TatB [Thiomonas delicata]